jgi:predicted RNA-binding protein with PIN domain
MRFLIDGYNLMHALGMAPKAGGLSLERSRFRFVDWLAIELGERSPTVTLIFDSIRASGDGPQVHRGMQMTFAEARTADDHIEEMIQAEQAPHDLTIVSNDNRLQAAATRRRCVSWTCGEFVDWLQKRSDTPSVSIPKSEEEKPAAPCGGELDEWLQRFES